MFLTPSHEIIFTDDLIRHRTLSGTEKANLPQANHTHAPLDHELNQIFLQGRL